MWVTVAMVMCLSALAFISMKGACSILLLRIRGNLFACSEVTLVKGCGPFATCLFTTQGSSRVTLTADPISRCSLGMIALLSVVLNLLPPSCPVSTLSGNLRVHVNSIQQNYFDHRVSLEILPPH